MPSELLDGTSLRPEPAYLPFPGSGRFLVFAEALSELSTKVIRHDSIQRYGMIGTEPLFDPAYSAAALF
jgi:hypothetical protein